MSQNNYHNIKGVPKLHLIISTGLGTGFLPVMPGKWGALLALGIWYLLYLSLSSLTLYITTIGLIVVTLFVGVWTSKIMEQYWGDDPRTVNIDEFVGTWIPLLAAPCGKYTWMFAIAGFALFRIIDMTKPLGCRYMEKFKNGWGVMLDDVLAGIYALILLYIIKLILL